MIPTKVATAAIKNYEETGEHVLPRAYPAVIRKLGLEPEILNDSTGHIKLSLDVDNETLSVVGCKENKNEITFLTDRIGVSTELDLDVTYIDKETAVVTLKKGTAVLEHPDDFAFGISSKGDLIKPSKRFLWVDISTLYEVCCSSVRMRFNPPRIKIENYVMNAMFSIHVTASTVAGDNTRTYKVTNIYTTLACGKFEFETFEAPEIKQSRYTPNYGVSSRRREEEEEEQGILSMDDYNGTLDDEHEDDE